MVLSIVKQLVPASFVLKSIKSMQWIKDVQGDLEASQFRGCSSSEIGPRRIVRYLMISLNQERTRVPWPQNALLFPLKDVLSSTHHFVGGSWFCRPVGRLNLPTSIRDGVVSMNPLTAGHIFNQSISHCDESCINEWSCKQHWRRFHWWQGLWALNSFRNL